MAEWLLPGRSSRKRILLGTWQPNSIKRQTPGGRGKPLGGITHKPPTRGNKNMNTNNTNKNKNQTNVELQGHNQSQLHPVNLTNYKDNASTDEDISASQEARLLQSDEEMDVESIGGTSASNDTVIELSKKAHVNKSTDEAKRFKNGGMRRRFQYLRFKGLPEDRALELAAYTATDRDAHTTPEEQQLLKAVVKSDVDGRAPKRKKPNTTLSPQETSKDQKRPRATNTPPQLKHNPKHPGPSFSDTVKAVRMAIVPLDYPKTKLTDEDFKSLTADVKQKIFEQRREATKPNFTRLPQIKAGWMILHCEDRATADWVKSQHIGREKLCKIVEEADFPKEQTLVGFFQGSAEEENDMILGMVQGQNKDLDTESWKVLHRENHNTCAELTIELDSRSAEQLKAMKYTVRYGFGQKVTLRPKWKGKSGVSKPPLPQPRSQAARPDQPSTSQETASKAKTGESITPKPKTGETKAPQPKTGKPLAPKPHKGHPPSRGRNAYKRGG